jgi:hypothetical protein
MTSSDAEFLKVYLLLAPVLLVLFGFVMMALIHWQDAREDRRRLAKDAPSRHH